MDSDHHQNQDDDKSEGSSAMTSSDDEIEFKTNNSASKGCYNEVSSGEKQPTSSQNHKCGICGKSFSSGKALGGHKRSHFQALKKEAGSSKKASCNNNGTKSPSTSIFCYVCNKEFPSSKSLHGHLRSHPDRTWRGVNPPPPPAETRGSCSSSSDSDGDDDDDGNDIGSRYLPQEWGVYHSRNVYHKRKNNEISTLSNDVVRAARILMQMSRDKWSQPPQHVEFNENGGHCDELNGEKTSSESRDEADNEEEDANRANMRYMNGALKGKITRGTNRMRDLDEAEDKRRKLVVRIKLPNSESKAENSRRAGKDEYQCDICVKSFSTPQALGGHKSSHYKEKKNRPSSYEGGESSQAAVARARVWDFDLNDTPNVKQDEI